MPRILCHLASSCAGGGGEVFVFSLNLDKIDKNLLQSVLFAKTNTYLALHYPSYGYQDALCFKLVSCHGLLKYQIEYAYRQSLIPLQSRNLMHKRAGLNFSKSEYYQDRRLFNLSLDWEVLGEVFPTQSPRSIYIGLQNTCNASCNHCPWFGSVHESLRTSGYFESHKRLETSKVYEILDYAITSKSEIVFSGPGEPLLDERIFDFLAYAKRGGLTSIALPTNGILLDLSMLKRLILLGVSDLSMGIFFSPGSYAQKDMPKILKKQAFENLSYLKKEQPNVKMQFFVCYEEAYYQEALDLVLEFEEVLPKDFILSFYDPKQAYWQSDQIFPHQRHSCGFVSGGLYVFPCGSVSFCEMMRSHLASKRVEDLSFGNIYQSSLKALWEGEGHKMLCQAHRRGENTQGPLEICQSCVSGWWSEKMGS